MKRTLCIIIVLSMFLILLTSCGASVSDSKFNDISKYVIENNEDISPESETKFYVYGSSGLAVGGVNYGYYYSENNEILIPDFYSGGELGKPYKEDEGTYFGESNSGKDWCYIRQITDKWFYYELHW